MILWELVKKIMKFIILWELFKGVEKDAQD